MTVYTKTMMDALKEVRDVQTEASMSSSQIAMLKKAYEPMRDKKISVKNANKLSALMDKFAKNKDVLLQLAKADIPFVSSAAVTKLISKHGMKGAEINKYKKEEMEFWAELDEGKEKSARQLVDPKKEVMVVKKSKVIVIDKKDEDKYLKKGWSLAEEVELDEAKYELYHKDFSSAMQHAYKMAKKLHGITIKPSEIDDKVASGPRKPSEGKTNTYRLEGDKGAIQVQVYNKGGSKPYELNFYKEEVEIDEALPGKWPSPGVKRGTRKDLEKLEKELQAAKKKKDKKKADALQKELERLMKSGKGKKIGPSWMHKEEDELDEPIKEYNEIGTDEYRKHTQEVTPGEMDEASARADAKRAMRSDPSMSQDPFSKDDEASPEDVKGAEKNIIMQLRGVVSLRGVGKVTLTPQQKRTLKKKDSGYLKTLGSGFVEFVKGKEKVDLKIAQSVLNKYNSIKKPADKEKFQAQIGKSYKDMLKMLKAGYNEETELDEMSPKDKILKKTADHLQALIKGSNNKDDKDAFAAARDYVEAGNLETVATIVKKLDTAPKEAIINAVAKGMGKKEAEKIFKVRILRVEEVELDEFKLTEAVSVKDFDSIKKGDTVTIKYESAMSSGSATFKVTAKNMVGKGKKVEKVTMKSTKNPGGVKFFLYKRDNKVGFAIGDMGASVVSFKKEETILGRIDRKLKERKNG